jgi:hypothetical protein
MKNDPSLVKQKPPLGNGDLWVDVTSSHFALVDFRADPNGTECLRIPTGTDYEKQRAFDALRSVADFLESKFRHRIHECQEDFPFKRRWQ